MARRAKAIHAADARHFHNAQSFISQIVLPFAIFAMPRRQQAIISFERRAPTLCRAGGQIAADFVVIAALGRK